MEPGIDTVVSEAFVADLPDLPLDDVRARREAARLLENAVSYVRRLAHGRLDILGAEMARRGDGDESTGDLLDHLRASLGGPRGDAPQFGIPSRAPQDLAPTDHADPFVADLDAAVSPGFLADVAERSEAEIVAALDRLGDFEKTISARRRALHETLDRLQAELVRRYRDDGVDVGSVLGP